MKLIEQKGSKRRLRKLLRNAKVERKAFRKVVMQQLGQLNVLYRSVYERYERPL